MLFCTLSCCQILYDLSQVDLNWLSTTFVKGGCATEGFYGEPLEKAFSEQGVLEMGTTKALAANDE